LSTIPEGHRSASVRVEAPPTSNRTDAFRLDGRVAVVTGSSSGLGVEFARALADVGATLVLVARRTGRLEALAAELQEQGTTALPCSADVTSPEACEAVVRRAIERFGRVDVLVNNAGTGGAVAALKETPDHFRSIVDTNLYGSYWMAQCCARVMAPGSSIVNIASIHGLIAAPYPQAAYAASKAGIVGLTRDLARQWSGRRGIRVNALAPGYFDSEMTAGGREALELMVAEHSILGRFGVRGELDGALLFLASAASSYVTGTTLVVDGGLSAVV
jgi:NAD(P)-dependent dehydrogenase (short-subunit alcohol dehydrogenase family)